MLPSVAAGLRCESLLLQHTRPVLHLLHEDLQELSGRVVTVAVAVADLYGA